MGRKRYCVEVKDFRGTQPRYLSFINAQKVKLRLREEVDTWGTLRSCGVRLHAEFEPWTIDGKQLPPEPAYRLSVWKKGAGGGWQWISHANLASIP